MINVANHYNRKHSSLFGKGAFFDLDDTQIANAVNSDHEYLVVGAEVLPIKNGGNEYRVTN